MTQVAFIAANLTPAYPGWCAIGVCMISLCDPVLPAAQDL